MKQILTKAVEFYQQAHRSGDAFVTWYLGATKEQARTFVAVTLGASSRCTYDTCSLRDAPGVGWWSMFTEVMIFTCVYIRMTYIQQKLCVRR